MFSLATAISIGLRMMARLLQIRAPQASLQEEAKALARMGEHVRQIQALYEKSCLDFAAKVLGSASLSPNVKAVEVVETGDGVAVHFVLKV
jgi:hypothetical protein